MTTIKIINSIAIIYYCLPHTTEGGIESHEIEQRHPFCWRSIAPSNVSRQLQCLIGRSFSRPRMSVRGVRQIKRLVFRYCQNDGSSEGMRQLLSTGRLVEWCRENPEVTVETKIKSGRHPVLMASYLNSNERAVGVKNLSPKKIEGHMDILANSAGKKTSGKNSYRLSTPVQSEHPSIQGEWTDDVQEKIKGLEFSVKHY